MSNSYCDIRVYNDAPDGTERRVEIRSAFNEDFIKALKIDIPWSERRYYPEPRQILTIAG